MQFTMPIVYDGSLHPAMRSALITVYIHCAKQVGAHFFRKFLVLKFKCSLALVTSQMGIFQSVLVLYS
jgi:hypothetical protein